MFCLFQAEADLRSAQSEFDRQAEITKLLLEGITSTHVSLILKSPITTAADDIFFYFSEKSLVMPSRRFT